MFIKPASGMHVRDPATKRPLPAEGKEVRESSFWLRRLADGDVVLAQVEEPVVHVSPISDSSVEE